MYKILRLNDVGRNKNIISIDQFNNLSNNFVSREKDIEFFLEKNAIDLEKQKLSTTYLILNDNHREIIAYFTLVPQFMDLSDVGSKITNASMKKLIGSKYDKNDKNTWKVNTLLIAQLGKNQRENLKQINGHDLWTIVYTIIFNLGVSYRNISIECKNELISYYEELGFIWIKYNSMKKLNTLLKKNDIEDLLKNY